MNKESRRADVLKPRDEFVIKHFLKDAEWKLSPGTKFEIIVDPTGRFPLAGGHMFWRTNLEMQQLPSIETEKFINGEFVIGRYCTKG